jgi:hypothetical protein
MYNIQNYWSFGLRPSSGILEIRKHNVSVSGSVSVLRCEGSRLLCSGTLEIANLNHWIQYRPAHLRTDTNPASETFLFSSF